MTELDERLRSMLGERAADAAGRSRPSDDHLAAIRAASEQRQERRRWFSPQVLVAAAVVSACALVGAQLVRIAIDDGSDEVQVVDRHDVLVLDTSLPGWLDVHFGDWTHQAVQTLYEPALRQRSTFEVTLDPELPGTLREVRQCLVVGERFACTPFNLPPVPLAAREDDTFGSGGSGGWRPDVRGGDAINVAMEPRIFTPSGWLDCTEADVQCGVVLVSSEQNDDGGYVNTDSFVPLDPTPASQASAAEREQFRLPSVTAAFVDSTPPAVRVRTDGIDPVPIRPNGASPAVVAEAMELQLNLCVVPSNSGEPPFCNVVGGGSVEQHETSEGVGVTSIRSVRWLDPFTRPASETLYDCAEAWCFVSVRQMLNAYDYPGWTDPPPQGITDAFSVVVGAALWPVDQRVPLEAPPEVTAVLHGDELTLSGRQFVWEPASFEAYVEVYEPGGASSEYAFSLDFRSSGEVGLTTDRADDGTWSFKAQDPQFWVSVPPEVPRDGTRFRVVVRDAYQSALAIAVVERS